MSRPEELAENLAVARGFVPMTANEQAALVARTAPLAADGRLEPFKTTTEFEGPHHKRQHQAGTPASR
jgi:hypothetical protein